MKTIHLISEFLDLQFLIFFASAISSVPQMLEVCFSTGLEKGFAIYSNRALLYEHIFLLL